MRIETNLNLAEAELFCRKVYFLKKLMFSQLAPPCGRAGNDCFMHDGFSVHYLSIFSREKLIRASLTLEFHHCVTLIACCVEGV